MGLLKGMAKVVGTVVLGTVGLGTGLLNTAIETAGGDTSPTFLADIQDASFNTIKKMWKPDEYEADLESGSVDEANLRRRISTKESAMIQAMEMAEKAEKVGNDELCKKYSERYETLQEEANQLKEELHSLGY